jgi:hypothetical protein
MGTHVEDLDHFARLGDRIALSESQVKMVIMLMTLPELI